MQGTLLVKKLKWIVKHICKKCNRIVIKELIKNYNQVSSCFHCSAPQTSNDMFDVDKIEDLEEILKTFTNMCQEDIDV